MSRAPWAVPKAERAFAWGDVAMWVTTLGWRYPVPKLKEEYGNDWMGETAENIRDERQITRDEQDAFSLRSCPLAVAAAILWSFDPERGRRAAELRVYLTTGAAFRGRLNAWRACQGSPAHNQQRRAPLPAGQQSGLPVKAYEDRMGFLVWGGQPTIEAAPA